MKSERNRCFVAAMLFVVALTAGPAFAGRPPQAGGKSDAPTVRVGGDVKPPVKTKDVKPDYPQIAKDRRVQGVVIIEATIGTDGKVKDTKVIRPLLLLTESAVAAVRGMEFKPTIVDGHPVQVIMTIPINFVLQ